LYLGPSAILAVVLFGCRGRSTQTHRQTTILFVSRRRSHYHLKGAKRAGFDGLCLRPWSNPSLLIRGEWVVPGGQPHAINEYLNFPQSRLVPDPNTTTYLLSQDPIIGHRKALCCVHKQRESNYGNPHGLVAIYLPGCFT
jgi:hypothetical protein